MPTRSDIIGAHRKAIGGGRRLRCRKGKSCSAACINRSKFCLVDAPTPVTDSLPRAVRAIQNRKERLGPREERRVLQKKRKGIKEKAQQRAKLKQSRDKYIELRKALRSKIERAILDYDPDKESKLTDRLNKLEEGIGNRLGVPKLKPLEDVDKDRIIRTGARFARAVNTLYGRMRDAAEANDRREYDKLEGRLIRIRKKGGAMWDGLKDYYGWVKDFNRGSVWKGEAESRGMVRAGNLRDAYDRLIGKAQRAAWDNDAKSYKSLEKAILKIQSKRGDTLGISDSERISKGKLWEKVRLQRYGPAILEKVKADMEQAAFSNDRQRYDRLEAKLFRVRDKMGSDLTNRSLRDLGKGEMWEKARKSSGKAGFTSRLNKSSLAQGREGVKDVKVESDGKGVKVSSYVLGNKLDVRVSPNSTDFKVNGSHVVTGNLSRREKITIIREVTRQYDEIVKNLREGTVLSVSAAQGDGQENTREKAYVGYGFSKPGEGGLMYGKVENGRIVPISREEFLSEKSSTFS